MKFSYPLLLAQNPFKSVSNRARILILLFFGLVLIILYQTTTIKDYLNFNFLSMYVQTIPKNLETALWLLFFFAVGGVSFISIPLMIITVSLIFNWWITLFICLAGLTLSCSTGYLLGVFINFKSFSPKFEKVVDLVKKGLRKKIYGPS